MKVILAKQFKYAPDVRTTVTCEPGENDMPEEFAKIAEAGGYTKSAKSAPINKADKPSKNK